MKKFIVRCGLAAALAVAAPAAGSAAVIYSASLATGPIASPGSVSTTFTAASAAAGSISFQIEGYNSLDGDNGFRDNFSLFVNGVLSYSGTFDLGGGGGNLVTFALPGVSSFVVTPTSTGVPTFLGAVADIVTPISIAAGVNTLLFQYDSPGSPLAGPQGLGDEAWGVNTVSISAAVPEPSTWAMMLIGFAGLAMAGARRKRLSPA